MENLLPVLHQTVIIVALLVAVIISVRSIYGLFSGVHYADYDRVLANFLIIFVYLQLVFELVYFFGSTHTYEESFEAIEHIVLIVVATAATQVGRLISVQSQDDAVKFRFRSVFYGIATGLLLVSYFGV